MSVVLKNVLHSRCRQGKMPDFNVKRFLLYPEIRNRQFQTREGMERTQRSSVLYINNARLHCQYIPNGVGLLFLFSSSRGRLAMPVFR